MTTHTNKALLLALTSAISCAAVAAGSDASRLGDSLTPLGAEIAGNADGSIPAWTGGMATDATVPDAQGSYANPFADEQPLYTVDRSNAADYAELLSEGHQKLLEIFPEYRLPVYPTHRSARVPQRYYDQTRENVGTVTLTDDGYGVRNYNFGIPFPMPERAEEVMWNHLTRYRGGSIQRQFSSAVVQERGDYTLITHRQHVAFRENVTDLDAGENMLFYTMVQTLNPSRFAGTVTLVHDPINPTEQARSAWQFNPGQRRVRRAPTVAYDSSARFSYGALTSDSVDGFNGALDRYNWELVGKQEMLVPYNAYALHDKSVSYEELLQPGHIDQSRTRYEKHRVWVVDATLREGERHVYAKRRFYVDEDSWQILVSDIYDNQQQIWRVYEAHPYQLADIELPSSGMEVTYDLYSRRYATNFMVNEDGAAVYNQPASKEDFTPNAIKRLAR